MNKIKNKNTNFLGGRINENGGGGEFKYDKFDILQEPL
jgi:hypothetical protein